MKKLVIICHFMYCMHNCIAQQTVNCRITISYSATEKVTENVQEENRSKKVNNITQTQINLNGRVKGSFLDDAFTVSQEETLGNLSGSGRVTYEQNEVETIDCQTSTRKGSGGIGLDAIKSSIVFQFDSSGDYEVSNFSIIPEVKEDGHFDGELQVRGVRECATSTRTEKEASGEAGKALMMGTGLLNFSLNIMGDGEQSKLLQQMGGIMSLTIGHFEKSNNEYRLSLTKNFTDDASKDAKHVKKTEYTRSLTVSVIPTKVPKYEAFIEVESRIGGSLKEFIPLGPTFPNISILNSSQILKNHTAEEGNSLGFSVKIYNTSNHQLYNGEYQTTFYLEEVSHYPGYCMNYPVNISSPDTKPDLRFNKKYSGSNFSSIEDQQAITSMGHGDEFVVLTSYDYASFGILKAKVEIKGENEILIARYEPNGAEGIIIPNDEDHNHIADAWQQSVLALGKDEQWDEDDSPSGQRRNGDGYVLFEEYRGFYTDDECLKNANNVTIKDHHVRTDPYYKDAFVYDKDGLFQQYYCPNNPAEINWHYISPENFSFTRSASDPNNRWVNLNQCPYFYAKQYAIFIREIQGVSPTTIVPLAGLAYPFDVQLLKDLGYSHSDIEKELNMKWDTLMEKLVIWQDKKAEEQGFDTNGGSPNPMKDFHVVEIYSKAVEKIALQAKPDMQQAIYQLFIQGLVQHEVGHHIGIFHHGGAGKEKFWGVLDCVMRLGSGAEKNRIFAGRHFHYCRKNETWEEIILVPPTSLDPNSATPIPHTTRPAHNCWGQIDVKTD